MKFLLTIILLIPSLLLAATKTCTFTAADTTELSTYSASGEIAWTKNSGFASGNIQVSNANRAMTTTTSTSVYYANNFTPANYNYDVEATVHFITVPTSNNTFLGIGGRSVSNSAASGYMAWVVRASAIWQIQLARYGSATLTTVNITTPTAGQSFALKMTMRDHIVKIYWGGAEVINYQVDHTSANFLTGVGNATLYMDGVTSFLSNTTGIHIDDYTITDAASPTLDSVSVSNSDLWYNGYDGTGTPRQSPCASWKFTTAGTVLKVTGTTDIYTQKAGAARLGLRINNVSYNVNLTFTANETRQFTCYLAEGVKTIEIVAGSQISPDGDANVYGTYIDSIICQGNDIDPDYIVLAPSSGNKLVVYGDSISSGYNASQTEKNGVVPVMRNLWGKNVQLEAWGSRQFYEDGVDSTARAAFVSRLTGYSPTYLWMAIGTNDASFDDWTAAQFGTAYADLLDRLHTAMPTLKIWCQSPLQRISPDSESDHQDFRDQIATAVSTRTSYCTYINGAAGAFLGNNSIDTDGLHLSTSGQFRFADNIRVRVWGAKISATGATKIGTTGATISK